MVRPVYLDGRLRAALCDDLTDPPDIEVMLVLPPALVELLPIPLG